VVENTMDGTSGAIYAIYLNSLAHSLRQQSSSSTATSKVWAAALQQASKSLANYTPAQPGDRTLVDALHPFVETLAKTGDVKKAAEASRKGAEGTKGMKASLGRTVYIGGKGFEQVPDPGAWGLSEFFLGLAGVTGGEEGYELV
jgi:dihydroxyacetone kinase